MKNKGFTLIEILVAVAIIGFLVSLAVLSLNNTRQKAKTEKCLADLQLISKAIQVKTLEKQKMLKDITGSSCSDCVCRNRDEYPGGYWYYSKASVNDPDCVNAMTSVHKKIGYAGLLRDPEGNPYTIDENEGEGTNPCLNNDIVKSFYCGGIYVPHYLCKN